MTSHWTKTFSLFAALLMASLNGSAAAAQTVYRCGNEYTHVPCAQGAAMNASIGVTTGDRIEAERVVTRERRLGRDMEDDRRRQEAGLPTKAGSFTAAVPVKASASSPRKVSAKKRKGSRSDVTVASTCSDGDGVFTAAVPPAVRKR